MVLKNARFQKCTFGNGVVMIGAIVGVVITLRCIYNNTSLERVQRISPASRCEVTAVRDLDLHIQPTRSTRSSSCLTLSRPPVTSHLMFSTGAISITAPRLWNDLPPELRTISSLPP